jgi:hypothetical protein
MKEPNIRKSTRAKRIEFAASRLCDYLIVADGRWTTKGIGQYMDPVLEAIALPRDEVAK